MDSSFLQSQHPVVEELLTNKYFGDTLLVCANGHLTDNKLAVGLLFPSLLTSDIFALPIENVLLVPDYTMEEIGREFEKLIIGGALQTLSVHRQQPSETTSHQQSHHQPPLIVTDLEREAVRDQRDEATEENRLEEEEPEDYILGGGGGEEEGDTLFIDLEQEEQQPQQQHYQLQPVEVEPPDQPHSHIRDRYHQVSLSLEGSEELGSGSYQCLLIPAQPDTNTFQIYMENNHNATNSSCGLLSPGSSSSMSRRESSGKKKTVTFKDLTEEEPEPPVIPRHHQYKISKVRIEEYEDESVEMIENLHNEEEKVKPASAAVPSVDDTIRRPKSPEKPTKATAKHPERAASRSPEKLPRSPVKLKEPEKCEFLRPGRPSRSEDQPKKANKTVDGVTRFKRLSAVHLQKGTFKCGVCGKVLSCQGSFNRHSLLHTNNKPYLCRFCPSAFREASKRSVHERVHTGSKPFKCSLCEKSFRTASQRVVHLASHTKEKAYQCPVCHQFLSQKWSLKTHIKKMHPAP